MIYFAQLETGSIKIGTSENVDARIRQLEGHYGAPVALLATIPGGPKEERQLHERFSAFRLGRTEQFRPVREILEFIGLPVLVSQNPDAVEVLEPANGDSKPIKIGMDAYAVLMRLAGMRGMSLAECVSELVVRHGGKEVKEEARKILKED